MVHHASEQSRPASWGGRLFAGLKHELISLLPATIFFLVGFNLIAASKHVILAEHGIVWDGLGKAVIGALLVAKVVAVAGLLPVIKRLQRQALWLTAVTQAVIYTVLTMALHEIEILVRHAIGAPDLATATAQWLDEFVLADFVFVAVWVFALFVVFVALSQLIARSHFRHWQHALLHRDTRTD